MSITVSTPQQICNSALNLSMSKSLYSFPKSKRFNENHRPICDQIYNLSECLSKRKAGIGYGKKSDFTTGKFPTPSPNQYTIKDEFEKKKSEKFGWTFGESRDKMLLGGFFQKHLIGIPGPGNYEKQSQLSNLRYTMRQKTLNPQEFTTALKNPGPGAYQNMETITPKGQIYLSKYQSSGATIINPPSSQRFTTNYNNKIPGPGHYCTKSLEMSQKGNYYVSSMKNSMCRSFTHNIRHGIMENLKEKIPGVGSYRLPSEFGYYECAKK